MKQTRQTTDVQEAMGIVISTGVTTDPTPRLMAFVWGPAPEPASNEVPESRAA